MVFMTHTLIMDVMFVVETKIYKLLVDVVVVRCLVTLVGGNVRHIFVLQ